MCWRLPPIDLRFAFARPGSRRDRGDLRLGPLKPQNRSPLPLFCGLWDLCGYKKDRSGSANSGPEAAEPASMFTAEQLKERKDCGSSRERGEGAGGPESFLRITGRHGFAHPRVQSFCWISGCWVQGALFYFE